MAVNERDLFTFAIIAGMWLRDRKPVVRKALRISSECGGYTSSSLFERSLQRLVRAGWLVLRKEKRRIDEVNRYIPTLKGFAEYATTWNDTMVDKLMDAFSLPGDGSLLIQYYDSLNVVKCIEQRIPESAQVKEIGRALATLVDVATFQDVSLPPQYTELARAVEEAWPVDIVDWGLVEQVVDRLPALQCILLNAKANDLIGELLTALTHACRRGLAAQWGDALQKVLEGYLLLAQYCSHLGVQFDTKPNENLLRNLVTLTRCGNT